jgi:uncharacterized protein YndB with AHSA1/START domain
MKLFDVNLSREINASPDEIFDLWINPAAPGSPWHGTDKVIINPVVDGLYYHAMEHEGKVWAHYGRFVTLERGARIEHTWMSEATRGLETLVTVTLERRGSGTMMALKHSGIPDDDMGRMHQDGWTWMLNTIAERFEKSGVAP